MQEPTLPPPLCPRCNVPMRLRTAGRGPREGHRFYGCARYPQCVETAEAEDIEGLDGGLSPDRDDPCFDY